MPLRAADININGYASNCPGTQNTADLQHQQQYANDNCRPDPDFPPRGERRFFIFLVAIVLNSPFYVVAVSLSTSISKSVPSNLNARENVAQNPQDSQYGDCYVEGNR